MELRLSHLYHELSLKIGEPQEENSRRHCHDVEVSLICHPRILAKKFESMPAVGKESEHGNKRESVDHSTPLKVEAAKPYFLRAVS